MELCHRELIEGYKTKALTFLSNKNYITLSI